MPSPVRILALLCAIAVVGCATVPSGKTFDSAVGEWDTRFTTLSGKMESPRMTIIDETKASYGYAGGRLFFDTVNDKRKWEGYWVEDYGPNMSCAEKKDGSDVWGRVVFRFNDAYNSSDGDWDTCGEGKKFPWTGYR